MWQPFQSMTHLDRFHAILSNYDVNYQTPNSDLL